MGDLGRVCDRMGSVSFQYCGVEVSVSWSICGGCWEGVGMIC